MSVSKQPYKDKRGRNRRTDKYYIHFRDHREVRRHLPAFKDKTASMDLERLVMTLIARRAGGEGLDVALSRKVEHLTPTIRKRLAEWGVLDAQRVAALRPLDAHLESFRKSLEAQERAPKHIQQVVRNARVVFEAIGAKTLGEIRAQPVHQALKELRSGKGAVSAQTSNHHLRSARQFCKWAVATGLMTEDPLRSLKPLNVKVDRRRIRRAFPLKDLQALLEVTESGPDYKGLSGADRALIYRLAAETGLRLKEIASLRVPSFDLGCDTPTVTLRAEDSKHRKDDVIQLRASLAQRLRVACSSKGRWDVVFPMPKSLRAAEMLRSDLERAKIPVADDDGRVLDFHSLRHTFISNVLRSGASAAVVKSLARHSTLVLSVDTYGHLEDGEERLALQSLPDLDAAPVGEPLAATGTAASDEMQRPDLYSDLYSEGAEQCSPEQPDAAVWRRRRDLNPGWVAPRQFSKLLH